MYVMRYMKQRTQKSTQPLWSPRQTAIYHKYRLNGRSSTWIIVSASSRTESFIDYYVRDFVDIASLNPFEIHIIFLDSVITSWRTYIMGLAEAMT